MRWFEGAGIFAIILFIILMIVGIVFSIITAITITNALYVTGWKWWIVVFTLFGTISSPLITIKRD